MGNLKIHQLSPNMLKTFELCPLKYYFRFVKKISVPVNDEIFEFGKNIHALASYYLKNEFIDNLEKTLSPKEFDVWQHLKSSKYFGYEVINTEYNLAFKHQSYFLGGRLDALVKNGDEYFILDYKTGSAPKNAKYDFQTITDKDEIKSILSTYIDKYYDVNDDKETWFNKMKELTDELGYCSDMKEYKNNPDSYKGSVADVSTVIRVAVTTSSQTPDLYEILKLLGKERIEKRFSKFM